MIIAAELFWILCGLVIVLAIVSLCLFFKLKDMRQYYHEDLRTAEKNGFRLAMSVRLQDEDAYHAGYVQAMQDVHTDKTLIEAELSVHGKDLENRLDNKSED